MNASDISSVRLFMTSRDTGVILSSECLTFDYVGTLKYVSSANRPLGMCDVSEDMFSVDTFPLFSKIADYIDTGIFERNRYDEIGDRYLSAPYWDDHICIHLKDDSVTRIAFYDDPQWLEHLIGIIRGIYPKDDGIPRPYIIFKDKTRLYEIKKGYSDLLQT